MGCDGRRGGRRSAQPFFRSLGGRMNQGLSLTEPAKRRRRGRSAAPIASNMPAATGRGAPIGDSSAMSASSEPSSLRARAAASRAVHATDGVFPDVNGRSSPTMLKLGHMLNRSDRTVQSMGIPVGSVFQRISKSGNAGHSSGWLQRCVRRIAHDRLRPRPLHRQLSPAAFRSSRRKTGGATLSAAVSKQILNCCLRALVDRTCDCFCLGSLGSSYAIRR